MELFYSTEMENGLCTLAEEESRHCAKVLRHAVGDTINVIDGCGSLYTCKILECGKKVVCSVEQVQENFGAHGYNLTMAVCPTKNIDRYEWFLEKATEMGVDVIAPVIGEHSERRIIKPERLEKILVSAAKQSLKGAIPVLQEAVSVKQFIKEHAEVPGVKLIAYCGEQEKVTLAQAVKEARNLLPDSPTLTILIGPEGDFSPAEVDAAIAAGFRPLTLGDSRLRTETAAVAAVAGVYFMCG
jgi:16S rRNA (uracil1498-N3)-methyltransferase